MATIDRVIEEQGERIMSVPGVEGIGRSEEDGQPVILVMLSRPEVAGELPQTLGGYRLKFEVTGGFSAGG